MSLSVQLEADVSQIVHVVRGGNTYPKFSPGVPYDPVFDPVFVHSPPSHRHDVVRQGEGVELWENASRISLQSVSRHQGTTERKMEVVKVFC